MSLSEKYFSLYSAAIVLIAAIFSPLSAQAQDNDEELETVFVIGERRAYTGNIDELENPTASQAIDEQLLRDTGVINLNDALDLSASVARQNNFGGLWNAFSVRGFAGDINLPSGFLVNGFNAGRGFGGPRDIVGIESVEVMRGPRSALYGRGEPGGTVNLITKRPKFEKAGEVQATFGSWSQMRFTGDWQTVLGEDDNVGLRLVGFYEDAESFRETVETKKTGFYPSLKWSISEDTSFSYELEYTKQEIPFDRGVAFTEQFGFTPRETFVGEPSDGPIDTEVMGHQIEVQHNISDVWSVLLGLGHRQTSLTGNASETNFKGRQTLFLDGRTLSRFFRFRDFDSDYTVLRAELAGEFNTGGLRHRLLVGVDYDRFKNEMLILRYRPGFFPSGTDISTLDPAAYRFLDVFNPVYGQSPTPVPGPNTDREEVFKGIGLYFQDQIDITDRFQFRIGGRFDDFEQDLTNLRAKPAKTTSTSDTRFSPQIGAVYLVNDGVSVYASYGEGFRQQTGSDFLGNQFDPNVTESAEVGVKFDMQALSDSVTGSVTLAAFKVDQSNILVNDNRPEAVAAGYFSTSAGKADSQGVELDANLNFANDVKFWLSYAYTDAKFATTNPDADFGALIEAGDPLINSPKHQLNIQASKAFSIANMNAEVGAGMQYTDERLGWTAFDFFLPSYTTARIFGELKPSEKLSFRLDVDNAFDETFYTNSYADVWVEPGAPRRYRLTASYSF